MAEPTRAEWDALPQDVRDSRAAEARADYRSGHPAGVAMAQRHGIPMGLLYGWVTLWDRELRKNGGMPKRRRA